MMRKPSTKPTAGSASSSTPGLQLPIDYLSSVLGVSESNLLNLDQNLCENLFSNLFRQLQLNHVADLVHVRVEERLDSKMAGKIGSSGVSASAQAQAKKAEEDSYRSVFTKLILKQALALGFKGIINPATVSLAADKKLALRLLDFLAKKCYGPPPSSAERERVTPLKVKPAREEHASPTSSPTAASARRAPPVPAPASAASRPPKPSSAHAAGYHPSPKPAASRVVAAAPQPKPIQKHIASPGEQSYGSDEFDAEAGGEDYQQENEEEQLDDDFGNDDETEINDAEEEARVPLAKPIYDGKFSDREFDSSVSSAHSSVPSRAVRRQPAAAAPLRSHSRSALSKAPAAVVSPLAGANEENWTREDFKSELHAERLRHHETNTELQRMTQLYEQLLGEHRVEKFSARRVMLLKAQNMQLERQLGMMQQQTDATRSCMNELSTVVVGLENSVAEAAASGADSGSAPPPGLRKAANRLHGLESAISGTKHRLAKYVRGELQFSQEETKYLQPDAPLLPNSMYSGTLTHLNLDRVHALESSLAALHEQLLQAHQLLQSLALIPPFQQSVREFLSRAPQPSHKPSVSRMENLLDAIRTSAFELQSLGIALPSYTAFTALGQDAFLAAPITSNSSGSGDDSHESRWIWHVQQALKKRGVPSSNIDQIMARASQDHTATQLRFSIYEEQLKHYRELNNKMMIAVMEMFHSTQQIISKFYVQNNASFAEASRELNQCVSDWHRNSEGINVQRLLTTLQAIFPSVKQLLYNPSAAPSSATIGLPDIAANLQVDVEACVREFQQRLTQLQEQAQLSDSHDDHSQSEQYHEPRARRVQPNNQPSAAVSHPRASAARQHPQELPPFQF